MVARFAATASFTMAVSFDHNGVTSAWADTGAMAGTHTAMAPIISVFSAARTFHPLRSTWLSSEIRRTPL